MCLHASVVLADLTFPFKSLFCFWMNDELGPALGSGGACLPSGTETAPGDLAQRRSLGSAGCSCAWELREGGRGVLPSSQQSSCPQGGRSSATFPSTQAFPSPFPVCTFAPPLLPSGALAPQE